MKSKVSVVIPNYNGKEYLENCMESLMNQTFKNFEIVLVDDASSDNSAKDIMDKYDLHSGPTIGMLMKLAHNLVVENPSITKEEIYVAIEKKLAV